ncbi:pyridoxamine 5'-phosphate oxidase family protein [Bacteroides timonensis]|uniref:pyridoxamine 5'-phosphate oxidase family protein n=1 Tax=Bacteroides timonensis TaxID=1470345 RepID=UPI0004B1C6E1|nr:pyridoxamine 5'-phosphate oxidase family protein [Bacteroides timonensis]
MIYNNESVRRQDRLLEEANAYTLLKDGEYGVLSLQEESGKGAYGIPVNFVWDGENFIYIHCAPEGHKLRCISRCPEVSFCVVGQTNVVANKFTTGYESLVLTCHAQTGLSAEERMHALKLILQKYSPNDLTVGNKYAEKSFHRTEVIRLQITSFTGKCKRVH